MTSFLFYRQWNLNPDLRYCKFQGFIRRTECSRMLLSFDNMCVHFDIILKSPVKSPYSDLRESATIQISSSVKREFDAEKGWWARNTKGQHWIQVDLGKILKITKVGTGGLKGKGGNAKTFSVLYSNNGQSWEAAKEGGEKEVSSSSCLDL